MILVELINGRVQVKYPLNQQNCLISNKNYSLMLSKCSGATLFLLQDSHAAQQTLGPAFSYFKSLNPPFSFVNWHLCFYNTFC